ncbi:Cof-type HAD-IIB family hydrolase [Actinobacillus genomosp. 2]|uniref:Cof-type HAD-IIB family hydrolase n=1 Tax=Actinobacillus genomosp. 2 TaxID=230709 RepID=UPI002441036F|nr:Cof-type HAD-IIB family hydrolase [Actinobacillus genomosp. 2]WGE31709.1 Cof-type HAD-IIB family hydrolase [Actinobacillus genomosp. 2]
METYQYLAVFSDIDGTLLNNQHQITPHTQQAIHSLLQKHIPFIPVSARPPLAITPYTKQLQSKHEIICYSGALILDQDLKLLYSVSIDARDLEKLDQLLVDFPFLSINHYSGIDWFSNDLSNPWTLQEAEITGLKAVKKPQNLTNVHKILVMGEANQIQSLEIFLKQHLPHLSIHRSKNEYLEIMNKQATKSAAIRFMQQRLNVTQEQIIAFGDNFNDLDMLQYAGLSIAMGNAPDEVKAVAKRITASNNDDGIALILNEVFHLNT